MFGNQLVACFTDIPKGKQMQYSMILTPDALFWVKANVNG